MVSRNTIAFYVLCLHDLSETICSPIGFIEFCVNVRTFDMSSSWLAKCARQWTHEYVRLDGGKYAWNVLTIVLLLPLPSAPPLLFSVDPLACPLPAASCFALWILFCFVFGFDLSSVLLFNLLIFRILYLIFEKNVTSRPAWFKMHNSLTYLRCEKNLFSSIIRFIYEFWLRFRFQDDRAQSISMVSLFVVLLACDFYIIYSLRDRVSAI